MRIQITKKIFKILGLIILMLSYQHVYAFCSLSATNLVFGGYNPLSGLTKTSSANIAVTCNATTNITVQLSTGNSGNFTSRYMLNGGEQLSYNLYLDVGMQNIFGDGTSGTFTYSGVGDVSTIYIPVYGKIPANQNKSIGSYTDTINVNLFF
jgi:spore coat protein U-like protein